MIANLEELSSFNRTFERYASLTGKSRPDALSHVAKTLSMSLYGLLKSKASAKGQITNERLAALRGGKGLKISDTVKKRFQLNSSVSSRMVIGKGGASGFALQRNMAEAEIKFRESHRMFTAASAMFKGPLKIKTTSRVGASVTGMASPISGQDGDSFVFDWGSSISKWAAVAATGLSKKTRQEVFSEAIKIAHDDMMKYIERKQNEIARSAARSVSRMLK